MADWWDAIGGAITGAENYGAGLVSSLTGAPQPQPRPQPQAQRPLTDADIAAAPEPHSVQLTDAQVAQMPEGKPDFWTGFVKNLTQPWDNASTWLREGYRAIPGEQAVDPEVQAALGAMKLTMPGFGMYQPEAATAQHQQFVQNQAAQGRTPGFWGQLAGQAVSTAPTFAMGPIAGGALSGAMSSEDPNNPKEILRNAVLGAVGGKLGDLGGKAIAGAFSPALRPAAQTLVDEGAQLTPGQILGGVPKWAEDAVGILPIGIKNAQSRALGSLNRGLLENRALGPINASLPATVESGYPAMDFARKSLSGAFQDAYAKLPPINVGQPLAQTIQGEIAPKLADFPGAPEQFASILQNNLLPVIGKDNTVTGRALGAVDSTLGDRAGDLSRGTVNEQAVANALLQTQKVLRDAAAQQAPEAAADLQAARQGWSSYSILRDAVQRAGTTAKGADGFWGPSQLAAAVRNADDIAGHGGFATGQAPLQDVASAALKVLPPAMGDSGTVSHAIGAGVVGGGAHVLGIPNPATVAGIGAGALGYSEPVQAIARALLTAQRPAPIAAVGAGLRAFPEAWQMAGARALPLLAGSPFAQNAQQ